MRWTTSAYPEQHGDAHELDRGAGVETQTQAFAGRGHGLVGQVHFGRSLGHALAAGEHAQDIAFARGEARIQGTGADAGSALRIRFQNEHLIATVDDEPVATAPDLIVALDRETGEPITTEALRYGHRIAVVGAPCDERWHTPGGIELVGPRYFGYDIDPVCVASGGRQPL